MKNFEAYIRAIHTDPFIPKQASRTTAILLPELDTTEGIYRSLLPSYLFNGLDDFRVIVMGLSEKTSVSLNAKNIEIPVKLWQSCEHIVFPFVSTPLTEVVEYIKSQKPTMKFSYYIDFNYYLLPDSYPHSGEYNKADMIKSIEANIKAVDQVIVTNKALKDYIGDKLKERYVDVTFGTKITWQPLFYLPELMKTEYQNEPEKNKLSLLIIGDDSHFSDFYWIRGILKDLQTKYKEKIKLSIIGFDGKRGDKSYLKDVKFEYYKRVPFFNYYQLLKHIAPNLLLIPASDSKFNATSKNYIKYFELAYLNIPVIGPYLPPYTELITTNKNGFLCKTKDDYFMQVDSWFSAPDKFEAVLGPAYATATDYEITLANNIEILKHIYFPGYEKK